LDLIPKISSNDDGIQHVKWFWISFQNLAQKMMVSTQLYKSQTNFKQLQCPPWHLTYCNL